jgi:hypothetical protein
MPSDLPLMSTGRAMYPVPPQRGQPFGSTDPPQLPMSFSPIQVSGTIKLNLLRKPNTRGVHIGQVRPSKKPKGCVKLVKTRPPERWQSGRMRRFAKPLYGLTPVPRVRIPASPPDVLNPAVIIVYLTFSFKSITQPRSLGTRELHIREIAEIAASPPQLRSTRS